MSLKKLALTCLIVGIHLSFLAQQEVVRTMRSFVPRSNAYDIYYPLDFLLEETESGVVTITDTTSHLNITISNYYLEKKLKTDELIELLNGFLLDSYQKEHKQQDWNLYESEFDHFIELKTTFDNTNWVWYAVNKKKKLIVLSINKADTIDQHEIELVKFMIDKLIIN